MEPRSATAMTVIAPGMPERGKPRALERVDGDVDLGPEACADALVVEQHRRLVLLAFADHDDALHRHGVDHPPHQVDGRARRRRSCRPSRSSARRPSQPTPSPGRARARGSDRARWGHGRDSLLYRSYSGDGFADALVGRFQHDDGDPCEQHQRAAEKRLRRE